MGEAMHMRRQGCIYREISVPFFQFYCEPKVGVKNKVFKDIYIYSKLVSTQYNSCA